MTLLVNHHLIPITIQPQSISYEQICYKRSQGIGLTALFSFLDVRKQEPKANFKSATNVVLALKILWNFFEVCFFLAAY